MEQIPLPHLTEEERKSEEYELWVVLHYLGTNRGVATESKISFSCSEIWNDERGFYFYKCNHGEIQEIFHTYAGVRIESGAFFVPHGTAIIAYGYVNEKQWE